MVPQLRRQWRAPQEEASWNDEASDGRRVGGYGAGVTTRRHERLRWKAADAGFQFRDCKGSGLLAMRRQACASRQDDARFDRTARRISCRWHCPIAGAKPESAQNGGKDREYNSPIRCAPREKAGQANVEGHWDLRITPSLQGGVSLTLSPSSATRDARSRELNMQDGDDGRSTGRLEVRSSRSESDRSPGGKRKLPPSASPAKRLEARHRTEPPHLSIRSTPAGMS
jgi:hypothetical protein